MKHRLKSRSDKKKIPAIEVERAWAKAVAVGGDPDSLRMVGAGLEGIVLTDKHGLAYKVHNPVWRKGLWIEKTLDIEAMALDALSHENVPTPEFVSYNRELDVIVREFIEGVVVEEKEKCRELFDEVCRALAGYGITGPELAARNFVRKESGELFMVDLGSTRLI